MAEQNGVHNAAEGGSDENGNHAGPFHHPPQVLRHYPDLERPSTSANGLNLEEAGRPQGFNNQDVCHAPSARSGYAIQAGRRDVVNNDPPTLRLEGPARAEEEEESPILQENAQNTLSNPLRERLNAPHGDQKVPGNPEVFINQRAFEAAQEFRPRAANLPAQNEPLNFLPRENPLLRNNQGNPSLNVPPLNRAERVRGEEENHKKNVCRVSIQQRNRPVRVSPQVRPVEAYDADEKNDPPHFAAHPIPSPQPQLPVFFDRQPHFPAHSAAFPNPLPQRARAQRRAASAEVDHPRTHAEEAPPMAAPASGPHMSLPKLELPAFKGEKGAKAQIWLESLSRFEKFYRMTDEQAVELARFLAKVHTRKRGLACFRMT
jgi:hypothetical protein